MGEEFYSTPRAVLISDPHDLKIGRARALYDAVLRHPQFAVVELLRMPDAQDREALVVELECDGVPPNNPYGLRFRERLLISVGSDMKSVPDVYSLRQDFPRLVHQDQTLQGSPAHLCLYFEAPIVTLRSWTPEQFLHRICWWFEKNARGELHPADQPLEHLFFSTPLELVLPWDFEPLGTASRTYVVGQAESRPGGGLTVFVRAPRADGKVAQRKAALVELLLPPIAAGPAEQLPSTLGELADVLALRGGQLLPELVIKLREMVGEKGAPAPTDPAFTIILLHVPICRTAGGDSESVSNRAFFLDRDPLDVGEATGALIRVDQTYFTAAGILEPETPTRWREFQVEPMEVLMENTPEAARRQSGLTDTGPSGVVVGAGALGSALLNLWGRSGWGKWTVIDNDHVRPHNLSRHTAMANQVGKPKVVAIADLQQAATRGANPLQPVVADALGRDDEQAFPVVADAQCVFDVSAALDYPRLASTMDRWPRHASVFVTPSANAAVALVEDSERQHRLRTLESQYYRALIQEPWGRDHLASAGTFWSGVSCRDISTVMPYARVMAHAGLLAEQLPPLVACPNATIRIWQQEGDLGALSVHDVPVESERHLLLDDLNVYFDAGFERELQALRTQGLPNETGGVLVGYYDFNVSILVLVAALAAPPDSIGTPGSFERGVAGLKEVLAKIERQTAGNVRYIGEWHSHPRGHAAAPSHDDFFQLLYLAFGMAQDGLPGVQLIIGEDGDLSLLKGSMRRGERR